MLEHLRQKNPSLRLYSVLDSVFAPYGRVLSHGHHDALMKTLSESPIPASGNTYLASDKALEQLPIAARIRQQVFGGMPIQCGCCNGRGYKLNALEYHKCSEVNFTTTGLLLLLALPEDVEDMKLDSSRIAGFYLPENTLIEIFPRVLHFAPCRIHEGGFNSLVVLEEGVNAPIQRSSDAEGEERLLWMRGKWLLCHRDSPQASLGAYVGITGDNITLHI